MLRVLSMSILFAVFPLVAAAQPWCGDTRLTRTERAICADRFLGDLDTKLTALRRERGVSAIDEARWLGERDLCGSDILCIEDAYVDRIDQLTRAPRPAPQALRPWCSSSRLNPTERTICSDERLADMDAALGAVYGAAKASSSDAEQLAWLRETRDGCGTETICIGNAYLRRIVELGRRLRDRGE